MMSSSHGKSDLYSLIVTKYETRHVGLDKKKQTNW